MSDPYDRDIITKTDKPRLVSQALILKINTLTIGISISINIIELTNININDNIINSNDNKVINKEVIWNITLIIHIIGIAKIKIFNIA